MLLELFTRLWQDESGSVVATEYLMLGSVVAVGSASGLVAMRDGVATELGEFGNSVRETRQAHTVPTARGGHARVGGAAPTDVYAAAMATSAAGAPVAGSPRIVFECP